MERNTYTEGLKKGPQGVPGRRGGSGERGVCTELRVWGREEASRGLVSDRSVITAAPRSPASRCRHTHAEHSNGRGQHRTRAGDATNHPHAWQSRVRVESLGLGLGLGGWPTQARHRNGVERFLKILKTREVYVTAVCLSGKSIAVYHTCETDLDQESQRFL